MQHPTWDIGHVWSLSVEEQFYFVWPVLVLLLSPARARFAVIGYLALTPLVRFGMWAFFRPHVGLIEALTPLRLDAIAAGCLLALTARRPLLQDRLRILRTYPVPFAIAGMAVIAASCVLSSRISAYQLVFSYSVEAAAMCVVIWTMAHGAATRLGRIFESRPAVFVGLLSYSLYLWQQLFLNPHRAHWTTTWPYNLVLAAVVGATSYYVVESPFLRIKDRAVRTPAIPAERNEKQSPAAAVVSA
jgi:peptidoglycan/LPS O-acetylase OafA/YrhL